MHVLATALGLSLLGSCAGLLVASILVSFPSRVRTRLVPWLVSYAVGALLGVALLDILPEALTMLAPQAVFGTLLAGILLFFRVTRAGSAKPRGPRAPAMDCSPRWHRKPFLPSASCKASRRNSSRMNASPPRAQAVWPRP